MVFMNGSGFFDSWNPYVYFFIYTIYIYISISFKVPIEFIKSDHFSPFLPVSLPHLQPEHGKIWGIYLVSLIFLIFTHKYFFFNMR